VVRTAIAIDSLRKNCCVLWFEVGLYGITVIPTSYLAPRSVGVWSTYSPIRQFGVWVDLLANRKTWRLGWNIYTQAKEHDENTTAGTRNSAYLHGGIRREMNINSEETSGSPKTRQTSRVINSVFHETRCPGTLPRDLTPRLRDH
jgi:hypothetical protein